MKHTKLLYISLLSLFAVNMTYAPTKEGVQMVDMSSSASAAAASSSSPINQKLSIEMDRLMEHVTRHIVKDQKELGFFQSLNYLVKAFALKTGKNVTSTLKKAGTLHNMAINQYATIFDEDITTASTALAKKYTTEEKMRYVISRAIPKIFNSEELGSEVDLMTSISKGNIQIVLNDLTKILSVPNFAPKHDDFNTLLHKILTDQLLTKYDANNHKIFDIKKEHISLILNHLLDLYEKTEHEIWQLNAVIGIFSFLKLENEIQESSTSLLVKIGGPIGILIAIGLSTTLISFGAWAAAWRLAKDDNPKLENAMNNAVDLLSNQTIVDNTYKTIGNNTYINHTLANH